MPKGLVVYDSKTGHTEKMAVAIGQGMEKGGLKVKVDRVESIAFSDLTSADAIVLGTPTYFANMSASMKQFIDKSVELYPDKLKDRVGAVFTSSEGQGDYLALSSIVVAMLFHQMVIVGHQSGAVGATSMGTPDDKCIAECQIFGKRIADFTKVITRI
ncbi:MAG: NAD(P)H-dependent oxidoreductase [Dehalococcoidales bacterium]|nr:NAD(P)H-dependent oxidoreductase [Dehalococcoidales bacterium]